VATLPHEPRLQHFAKRRCFGIRLLGFFCVTPRPLRCRLYWQRTDRCAHCVFFGSEIVRVRDSVMKAARLAWASPCLVIASKKAAVSLSFIVLKILINAGSSISLKMESADSKD